MNLNWYERITLLFLIFWALSIASAVDLGEQVPKKVDNNLKNILRVSFKVLVLELIPAIFESLLDKVIHIQLSEEGLEVLMSKILGKDLRWYFTKLLTLLANSLEFFITKYSPQDDHSIKCFSFGVCS